MDVSSADRWSLNRTVFDPAGSAGHYESFYQRANHPTRPLAIWIRYTLFAPKHRHRDAIGKLWSVWFDGETYEHVVSKTEVPMRDCDFSRDEFAVRIQDSTLGPGRMHGCTGPLEWDLEYYGDADPILLLPERLYRGGFPKAKSLVALPLARFNGRYSIAGRTVDVNGWVGSQNHNWGTRHTDRYAFAQVAGFDGAPDAFLEVVTAKATIAGQLTTPWTTFLVLRHGEREYRLNTLRQAFRASATYRWFDWEFTSRDADVEISGHVHAPREAFVALHYGNPPGGHKTCLNSKIGAAELTITDRHTGERTELRTENRALFEILTDHPTHGVPIRA